MNEKQAKQLRRFSERITVGKSPTLTKKVNKQLKRIYKQKDANAQERADIYLRNWGNYMRNTPAPFPAGFKASPMFKDMVSGYRETSYTPDKVDVDEASDINEIMCVIITEEPMLMALHTYYASHVAGSMQSACELYNEKLKKDDSISTYRNLLKCATFAVGAHYEAAKNA